MSALGTLETDVSDFDTTHWRDVLPELKSRGGE